MEDITYQITFVDNHFLTAVILEQSLSPFTVTIRIPQNAQFWDNVCDQILSSGEYNVNLGGYILHKDAEANWSFIGSNKSYDLLNRRLGAEPHVIQNPIKLFATMKNKLGQGYGLSRYSIFVLEHGIESTSVMMIKAFHLGKFSKSIGEIYGLSAPPQKITLSVELEDTTYTEHTTMNGKCETIYGIDNIGRKIKIVWDETIGTSLFINDVEHSVSTGLAQQVIKEIIKHQRAN